MSNFKSISFILSKTSHPGNIGAVARAMKTMQLADMRLINPKKINSPIAKARASGAIDILKNAQIYTKLTDALADRRKIFGTSARDRSFKQKILTPSKAAKKIIKLSQQNISVAILFGNERAGLSNEEAQSCHYLIKIPTNPDFSSLNIASAAQIISYEIYKKSINCKPVQNITSMPADHQNINKMLQHLFSVLEYIGFNSIQLQQKLSRYFLQNPPTDEMINIWRGIFKKVIQNEKT
jgi:tRNA (cytidine32/uridine32-2'-O)-methyltransferase